MSLRFPGAFDEIEQQIDGVDAPTGESWSELADGVMAATAVAGNLGTRWSTYPTTSKVLKELMRFASGVVSTTSVSFDSGNGALISFPAGVFGTASRIGVVAFRVDTGAIANGDTTPFTFEARSITTGGATLVGWQRNGSAPTTNAFVEVAWVAMEERVGATAEGDFGGTPWVLDPDVYPPVVSGFDPVNAELPNKLAFQIEVLTRATGKKTVEGAGAGGNWSTVAALLSAFDAMAVGEVSAPASDFDADPITGPLGVKVTVDGTLFPDPAQVQVFAMSKTDGADDGGTPGSNYPIVFAARDVQGGGLNPLTFRLVGWARNGGDPTVNDQITVRWAVRKTMPSPG